MLLRDIRRDLQDRLAEVTAKRKQLEEQERALCALLADEERRWRAPDQPGLFEPKPTARATHPPSVKEASPNIRFLLEELPEGETRHINDLVHTAIARGLNFEGKNPRRVLHFVLLGLMQRKLVKKSGEGQWTRTRVAQNGRGDAAIQ